MNNTKNTETTKALDTLLMSLYNRYLEKKVPGVVSILKSMPGDIYYIGYCYWKTWFLKGLNNILQNPPPENTENNEQKTGEN